MVSTYGLHITGAQAPAMAAMSTSTFWLRMTTMAISEGGRVKFSRKANSRTADVKSEELI